MPSRSLNRLHRGLSVLRGARTLARGLTLLRVAASTVLLAGLAQITPPAAAQGLAGPTPSDRATVLAPGAAEAEFIVDMAALVTDGRFDPARDRIGLRGGAAPLSWVRSLPAVALGEGRYGLRVRIERRPFGGQPLLHKFIVERGARGLADLWEPGRNHALWLQSFSQRADQPLRTARAFGAEPAPVPLRRTGTFEFLGVVASAHVAPRAVQVWLPPGYAAHPTRRYPVLVLHDGQNVFDASQAGLEWQVDETAQRLAEAGAIEAPIIVAVDAGPDRILDYTPTRSRWGDPPRHQGGGAAAYGRFLAEEVLPLVARRYRTEPGPQATAVGGSSLGGLVSLWLALNRPDVFGSALVVSPSLWWDGEAALRDVLSRPARADAWPRVWLDMGAREGAQALPQARRLREALQARGWTPANLAYVEDPHGDHDEAAWAGRVEGMLRFLYGMQR